MMLKNNFNLVDEGWIPCICDDGSNSTLSLVDLFDYSDNVIDIQHHSPVVKMALYRLLVTIALRCEDCMNLKALANLWDRGLDKTRIKEYLYEWRSRFDIFNDDRPFYQVPDFKEGSPTTVRKLMHEKASHNNATLFDHSFDEDEISICPSEAALLLLANQSYGVGGGKSSTGENFRHGPLMGKAPVLLKGKNIGESIRLNLISYDPKHPCAQLTDTLNMKEEDLPAWEAARAPKPSTKREALGLLDYYTWQSRAIRLVPERQDENVRIAKVYFSQGVELLDPLGIIRDPMVAYQKHEKLGMLPQKLDISKAQWRSLPALLHSVPSEIRMPKTIETVGALIQNGKLKADARFGVEVLGLYSDKAKIDQWSQAIMPLPAHYIVDHRLVSDLEQAIMYSERMSRILEDAARTLAKELVPPGDAERVNALVRSLDLQREYWSRLENQFYELIDNLAKATLPHGASQRDMIMRRWFLETVCGTAKICFEKRLSSLEANTRNLKASVRARSMFYGHINIETKKFG